MGHQHIVVRHFEFLAVCPFQEFKFKIIQQRRYRELADCLDESFSDADPLSPQEWGETERVTVCALGRFVVGASGVESFGNEHIGIYPLKGVIAQTVHVDCEH